MTAGDRAPEHGDDHNDRARFLDSLPEGRFDHGGDASIPSQVHRTARKRLYGFAADPAHTAWLLAVCCLATLVRAYRLADESLWLDEITSITARAALPPATLIETVAATSPHPPLYFLALRYWLRAFGETTVAARSLSVLFGVGAVYLLYAVGRALFDARTGLLAALVLAVNPLHVQYAREVRMYSLYTMLAFASMYFLVRLRSAPRSRRVVAGYLLTSALLCYTHAFGAFVVLAQNCYVLGFHRAEDDTTAETRSELTRSRWVRLQLGLGALTFPWLLVFLERAVSLSGGPDAALVSWIPVPTPTTLAETLLVYSGYLFNYPFALADPFSRAIAVGLLAVFAALAIRTALPDDGLTSLAHGRLPRTGTDSTLPDRRLDLLSVWLVVPIVVPYALSYLLTPIYVTRFTMAASGALVLFAARGLVRIERDRVRAFLIAVVVLGSLTSVGLYHDAATQEDWRGVGDHLDARAGPDEPVLVAPSWADRPVRYYTERTGPIVSVAPSNGTTSLQGYEGGPLAGDDRLWVVVAGGHDGADAVLDALGPSHVVTDRTSFGTIDVYRVEIRPRSGSDRSPRADSDR